MPNSNPDHWLRMYVSSDLVVIFGVEAVEDDPGRPWTALDAPGRSWTSLITSEHEILEQMDLIAMTTEGGSPI